MLECMVMIIMVLLVKYTYRIVSNYLLVIKIVNKPRYRRWGMFNGFKLLGSTTHGVCSKGTYVTLNYTLLLESRDVIIATVVHEFRHVAQRHKPDLREKIVYLWYMADKEVFDYKLVGYNDEYYTNVKEVDAHWYQFRVLDRLGIVEDIKLRDIVYYNKKELWGMFP